MLAALDDTSGCSGNRLQRRSVDAGSMVAAAMHYEADAIVAAFGSRCAGNPLLLVVDGDCPLNTVSYVSKDTGFTRFIR